MTIEWHSAYTSYPRHGTHRSASTPTREYIIYDYDQAIAYLEHLMTLPVQAEPGLGLRRAQLLLTEAGLPQERFATLHVTGSSGKGSTVALAAAILRAGARRVGAFTSPHLRDYTERIAVDGAPIPRADFARLLDRFIPTIEAMAGGTRPDYDLGRPAFMEIMWTLAATYFAEQAVDVVVVEVGLGGRYDATNVNNARVAVITNVSLEHTHRLGGTTAEIASHKAGVAKPGGIVITAAVDPAALTVIEEECARQHATLWRVTPESAGGAVRYAGDRTHLRIATPAHTYRHLRLNLLGRHQHANAACAVAAVDALGTFRIALVDEAAVRRGLDEARVPGRMEQVADDPVTVLDSAKNPDAARATAATLRELFPHTRPVLLLGILADKDVATMVDLLAPLAAAIVVTEPPWERRGGKGAEIARLAQRYVADVAFVPDVAAALARAQGRAHDLRAPLVVTGSLILVGAVRRLVVSDA